MRRIFLNGGADVTTPGGAGEGARPVVSRCLISMLTLLRSPRRLAVLGGMLLIPALTQGQNAFSPGGNDYPIAGALNGDQTFPHAVIKSAGGYLVWQDNAADGNGLGIRAERLDANLNKSGPVFRVNSITVGDQEKPQVAALTNGGAVFVWQGGKQGFQKIYARFLPATGTNFSSTDIPVNTYTNNFQINPGVATLADGSVVVVWSSYGQDGYLQGIYGRRFTAAGVTNGSEFQINQFTLNNQRTPAVTALAGGGFAVAWVSELQRGASTVDIFARVFDASGAATGNEFPVNTVLTNICANPALAASPDGGFAVAWSQRDVVSGNTASSQFNTSVVGGATVSSWDCFARIVNASGAATTAAVRLNTVTYGDQYAPAISAFGKNYLAVWQSLGQDGSMEGVYGQFMSTAADLDGVEFRVNSDNATRQIHPSVASDGVNRFLVNWASYSTSGNVDLFARSYDLIRVEITPLAAGVRLTWNAKPGRTYQVQSSTDYRNWSGTGAARVATGYSDSVDLASAANMTVYRVVRLH